MSLKLAFALLALPACDLGQCETVEQDGPGLTGTAMYTTADGAQLVGTLRGLDMRATDAFDVDGVVTDAFGHDRSFVVTVRGVAAGRTTDLAQGGEACMRRQSDSEPVCAPLTGTVDTQAFSADCYQHESGVGFCAETIELALHARSDWEGTVLVVDGEMHTTGSWVPADDCD